MIAIENTAQDGGINTGFIGLRGAAFDNVAHAHSMLLDGGARRRRTLQH